MKKSSTYIGIILLMFFSAVPTFAQTVGQGDPIQVLVSPEVPGPGELVRIEVQGIGTFLGDATITWQKNSIVALKGVGERVFTFTTGGLGSVTKINLTINSSSRGTMTRELTFAPSTVHLVWEADTTVPPFYRGKALYSAGARITVTAFPQIVSNGSTISSNSLTFQWRQGGEPVVAQSGKGRNTFSFTGDQLRTSESVGVDVYLGSVRKGRGSIVIYAVAPQIVLYPRDPLRGVLFDQALPSGISLTGKEITVEAIPYFFSNESLANGNLLYEWTIDNRKVTGPEAARGILTLRQTGTGTGSANLGVALQNTDTSKLLQSAETFLRIVFGAQSSSGLSSFFGL